MRIFFSACVHLETPMKGSVTRGAVIVVSVGAASWERTRDGNFTRGYSTRRVRVWVWNFTRGYRYGYKILTVSRVRVKNFTRGYSTCTRNIKNNLVSSYHSQILCLIFLWLYELNRRIVRLCELIDVKMALAFCLLFIVKRMIIVTFFIWNT